MVSIHKISAKCVAAQNSDVPTQNSDVPTQNSDVPTQNSDVLNNAHECPRCAKIFLRNWSMMRHIEKCSGKKDRFECEHCHTRFRHEKSRFHHYKVCNAKNNPQSPSTKEPSNQVIQNNTININNTIGTQNNNNLIIVYSVEGNQNFKTDHLKAKDLKKILELATPYADSRAIAEYSKQIFANPENRCVKKSNIRSGHSEIHTGDNKWELELDKILFPRLANDVAVNMGEFLHTKRDKLRREAFDRLTEFVDYMADSGYINTSDMDRKKIVENEYKTFVRGLKLIVYGNTKSGC